METDQNYQNVFSERSATNCGILYSRPREHSGPIVDVWRTIVDAPEIDRGTGASE